MDRRAHRRIRSGRTPIEDSLDLHGKSRREAFAALREFILRSAREGKATVRIITGRGRRVWEWDRDAEGVLHACLGDWLRHREIAPHVIQPPRQAGIGHGGEGAWYVRLRRRRSRSGAPEN